ncbi:MAG TPA: AlpA family phage regulatory protein [Phycisphaerae bacterium]|nr:AlpA family phage regulatory protein [Phycisphaerae bacterium]HNU44412.1 AlpA family phage regulatory protein [Phycisphaerae bacterium]
MPDALLVDAQGAAKLLGVARSQLYALLKSARLPLPIRLGIRATRWRVEELRAWTAAGCPPRHKWTWSG